MSIRKEKFFEGGYFHVFVRGVNKQKIFFDKRDYVRFLFYILFFQSPLIILNIDRRVTNFIKTDNFNVSSETIEKIIKNRYVELVNFSLMPNHIHLTLKEEVEGGISRMMQRTLDGFTRYSHVKYGKSGHVFEGPFKAVCIEDNNQLLYLSTYIHKNPKELKKWQKQWDQYPWSSYQDFIGNNRWRDLLSRDIILKQFKTPKEYAKFVKVSIAKETFDDDFLIDP